MIDNASIFITMISFTSCLFNRDCNTFPRQRAGNWLVFQCRYGLEYVRFNILVTDYFSGLHKKTIEAA